MDDKTEAEWLELGRRLCGLSSEKFAEALSGMRDVVEAQEILSRFDRQLLFRGRPRKLYEA